MQAKDQSMASSENTSGEVLPAYGRWYQVGVYLIAVIVGVLINDLSIWLLNEGLGKSIPSVVDIISRLNSRSPLPSFGEIALPTITLSFLVSLSIRTAYVLLKYRRYDHPNYWLKYQILASPLLTLLLVADVIVGVLATEFVFSLFNKFSGKSIHGLFDVVRNMRSGDLPSVRDAGLLAITLVVFVKATAYFAHGLEKRIKLFSTMRSFKSIREDLSSLSKATSSGLLSLVEVKPDNKKSVQHRQAIDKKQYEYRVSIASACASVQLPVDPRTIDFCVQELMQAHKYALRDNRVRRIVTCSTLVPKQWLNRHLIPYLMTTLALDTTTGDSAAHKCRYYHLKSQNLDAGDYAVLKFLEDLHEMFGFEFKRINKDQLTPILDYQRLRYKEEDEDNIDPAFLFIEHNNGSVIFYRIMIVDDEVRPPYKRKWEEEKWRPVPQNRSVTAYQSVIETLCPLPSSNNEQVRMVKGGE